MEARNPTCVKCGFGSYGARWVYGDKAYQYQRTQKPWKEKKLARFQHQLEQEVLVSASNPDLQIFDV